MEAPSTPMYIRLYVEGDVENASIVAAKLCKILSEFAEEIVSKTPGPYWKIPSHYEVYVSFEISGDLVGNVRFVAERLGTGWQLPTGHYAVWSSRTGGAFFDSTVQWANIEPG